jgi:CHAD domain-containing protein
MKKKKKRWDDRLSLHENLRARLPKMARKYLTRGAQALRSNSDWEELHQFRLATKRIRYTLEIFAPLYGPGFAARIEHVKKVQTLLGEANDFIMASGLLRESDGQEAAVKRLEDDAEGHIRKLRAWWGTTMGTAAAADRWVQYFSRVRPPRRSERY